MKKLLILLYFPIIGFGQSTLIFSEYGEGSSFNKWIEIYNPTFQNIYLDEYRYNFCFNGCDSMQWEYSIPFDSGYVLLPGQTYLLVHHNADSILLNSANQTTNILSNGDDVSGLLHASFNTIVDIIGVLDSADNISAWDVDGITNATQNHTMIRKPEVCGGNIGDWFLSDGSIGASQWVVSAMDNFSNINTHSSNCITSTSIKSIELNVGNLIEVRDIFGRTINIITNQPLFYIYDDGTVEKRIVID